MGKESKKTKKKKLGTDVEKRNAAAVRLIDNI